MGVDGGTASDPTAAACFPPLLPLPLLLPATAASCPLPLRTHARLPERVQNGDVHLHHCTVAPLHGSGNRAAAAGPPGQGAARLLSRYAARQLAAEAGADRRPGQAPHACLQPNAQHTQSRHSVHGAPAPPRSWSPGPALWRRGRTCCSYSQRGAGRGTEIGMGGRRGRGRADGGEGEPPMSPLASPVLLCEVAHDFGVRIPAGEGRGGVGEAAHRHLQARHGGHCGGGRGQASACVAAGAGMP